MSPFKPTRRENYRREVLKALALHGLGVEENV